MESRRAEIVTRIRTLREDLGISIEQMAEATGRTAEQYEAQEAGGEDLSFTFLYKSALRLGVDVIELLTGESPHLTNYSIVRKGEGLHMRRRAGFEYLHQAPFFKNKFCEPFIVTAPYLEEEQDKPIHLSRHRGQELDYIISGRLRFAHEDRVEELGPGDTVLYDSGLGHGMIATGGEPCVFLAIVMKPADGDGSAD